MRVTAAAGNAATVWRLPAIPAAISSAYAPPNFSGGRVKAMALLRCSVCAMLGVGLLAGWVAPSQAQAQAQARAQAWPQRTVRFILTLGAGSGTDIGGRLLADRLTKRWGQPVVIENKP